MKLFILRYKHYGLELKIMITFCVIISSICLVLFLALSSCNKKLAELEKEQKNWNLTKNETKKQLCLYESLNEKLIHEKHLCQLFGTTEQYKIENKPQKKVVPLFICHNKLSDTAKKFAGVLGIEFLEGIEIDDYPMVKCNLESHIYHLPLDLSYYNILDKNSKTVSTVKEAEALGCRRAYRWHGEMRS